MSELTEADVVRTLGAIVKTPDDSTTVLGALAGLGLVGTGPGRAPEQDRTSEEGQDEHRP